MQINVRNVNDAFVEAVQIAKRFAGDPNFVQESRNGDTIEYPEPVLTVYEKPQERILFSKSRDANVFFHIFEGLWMLAGRSDVKFLARFNKRMVEYSDDAATLPASYGVRMRSTFGVDQLRHVIDTLREDPNSRRAVIALYGAPLDPQRLADGTKDIPCNTTMYFKVRDGQLNMTVCCRSNDVLWGAYGANAVHFSMIQEYVADKLGVPVGTMYQLSDSWHFYTGGPGGEVLKRVMETSIDMHVAEASFYANGMVGYRPMKCAEEGWDYDLRKMFAMFDEGYEVLQHGDFMTKWFRLVVVPLWNAHTQRSVDWADYIQAADIQLAAIDWLKSPFRKGNKRA